MIRLCTACSPTNNSNQPPNIIILANQWASTVSLWDRRKLLPSSFSKECYEEVCSDPNLTWQASILPSVWPAQSIRGVISPLYIHELLHFFVLIKGTWASFSVSGIWTVQSKINWYLFICVNQSASRCIYKTFTTRTMLHQIFRYFLH